MFVHGKCSIFVFTIAFNHVSSKKTINNKNSVVFIDTAETVAVCFSSGLSFFLPITGIYNYTVHTFQILLKPTSDLSLLILFIKILVWSLKNYTFKKI